MPAYLPTIPVVFIDENGYDQPLGETTIHALDVTTGTPLSDLVTDADGIIAEGIIGVSAGNVVELSTDLFPLTAQWIAGASQDDAYSAKNGSIRFIAGNLFTDEIEPTSVDVYYTDPAGTGPQYLGEARFGEITKFPHQSQIAKTITVYPVSKGESFLKTENAFKDGTSLVISATRGAVQSLFDHTSGYTTTSTSTEDAYIDLLQAGMLARDGDKLHFFAHLFTQGNNNSKEVIFDFGGAPLISASNSANDRPCTLIIEIMRVDVQAIYYNCTFLVDGERCAVTGDQVIGLDLDATDYEMKLQLTSPDAAGDITVRFAHYIYYPAATGASLLLGGGDPLLGGGDYLIGT